MPAPVPVPVRQLVFQRWQKGEPVSKLAQQLALSQRTVRHLVRRFAKHGQQALLPDYARCATNMKTRNDGVFQQVLSLRQQHPGWGAGLIRVHLQEEGNACPRNEPCNVGSNSPNCPRRRQDDVRPVSTSGRGGRMRFGRWMPRTGFVWAVASA